MIEENHLDDATQRVLAFLAQPEIALGDAENMDLLLADPQLLRAACEDQLQKVTHLGADEIAELRAAFPAANWPRIAQELQARLQSADKFFADDAEETRQMNA